MSKPEITIKTPSFPVFGVLTIVLIVLKLTEVIAISWWWIVAAFFAPVILLVALIIVPLVIYGAVLGLALLAAWVYDLVDEVRKRIRRKKLPHTSQKISRYNR